MAKQQTRKTAVATVGEESTEAAPQRETRRMEITWHSSGIVEAQRETRRMEITWHSSGIVEAFDIPVEANCYWSAPGFLKVYVPGRMIAGFSGVAAWIDKNEVAEVPA